MTEAPEEAAVCRSLSDFLRAEREMPHMKTVNFQQLPHSHPVAAVMEMFAKCFEYSHNPDDDFYPDWHSDTDPNPRYEHLEPKWAETGDILARFSSNEAAAEMVSTYNGTYWKNAVVYAEFVDDSEMNDTLKAKNATSSTAKLFIPQLKPRATKKY